MREVFPEKTAPQRRPPHSADTLRQNILLLYIIFLLFLKNDKIVKILRHFPGDPRIAGPKKGVRMTKGRARALVIVSVLVLIFCFAAGSLAVDFLSARAADEVTYRRKIVSVLFDNSYSMRNSGSQNENRTELAKYSLEMLAALLSEQDELYITTMNPRADGDESTIEVDLSAADRESEIGEKIVDTNALHPNGTTPGTSVGKALAVLTGRGLTLAGDASYTETTDTEYWLVMLTDGNFDEGNTDALIERNIKGYLGLHTVYIAFGGDAKDLTDPNIALNKNYPFSAYYVVDSGELVSAMQDVSNKISSRYGAEAADAQYSVSGKEVVVDLDRFKFAVNNIAVIAQDCGATLQSVTYRGKTLSPTQKSALNGSFVNWEETPVQLVENGYVAVVSDGDCMSGGQVHFVYDREVGEDVSILVEPAIYIDAYLEREVEGAWVKTNIQEINGEMRPGEEVRVQYKVYSSATDEEIDLAEIFGEPSEKVTYCGRGYAVGAPIPLEKGSNAISVAISVLDGSYTMYSTIICYIEENPTYYRLEGRVEQKSGRTATVVYTLFVNDRQVDREGLKGYNVEVKVTYPDGADRSAQIASTAADGSMSVEFDGSSLDYGQYVFTAKVTDLETGLSRVNTQTVPVVPNVFEVTCNTSEKLRVSAFRLSKESFKVEFSALMDGTPTAFSNSLIRYKLFLGENDVTEKSTVEKGNLTIYLSDDVVSDLTIGTKTLRLQADILGQTTATASYEFEIVGSVYRVETVENGSRELDVHDLKNKQAAVSFRVYKDEIPCTAEELSAALESGAVGTDAAPFGWLTCLPYGMEISVEDNGDPQIVCSVKKDIASPFDYFLATFIFAREKTVTLTYEGATASDTISIETLNWGERIWRWVLFLIILLILLHIALFVIGFFVAKRLPKGMMLRFSIPTQPNGIVTKPSASKINMTFKEIFLWHLSRFIPFREFANQRPRSCKEVVLRVNAKTRRPELVPTKDMAEYQYVQLSSKDGQALAEVLADAAQGKMPGKIKISRRTFMTFLRKNSNEVIQKGAPQGIPGWYCVLKVVDTRTKRTSEAAAYHFVEYRRKRKKH